MSWAVLMITVAFIGILVRTLLPQGEKSALYPPVRFLLGLITALAVILPVWKKAAEIPDFSWDLTAQTEQADPLLVYFARKANRAAKEAFPEASFILEVYTTPEGAIDRLCVVGEEAEVEQIAIYLQERYDIPCESCQEEAYERMA